MAIKDAKREQTKSQQDNFSPEMIELEEENRLLKETVTQLRNEIDRYRSPALLVAELAEVTERDGRRMAIIRVPNGNKFLVDVSNDAKNLKSGGSIIVEQKNLTVIDTIQEGTKYNIEQFVIIDKPSITWEQIGGLKEQINEIQEVVELPLKKPQAGILVRKTT